MNALVFGATGMVGLGVLRECLLDQEVVHKNLWDYSSIETELSGFDACFFCLGVTSTGMKEVDYHRVTFGITMTAAECLSRLNPQMTFVYVSAAGTDSSEQGRIMWARVRGKTENALLRLPFHAAYMFRPGANLCTRYAPGPWHTAFCTACRNPCCRCSDGPFPM